MQSHLVIERHAITGLQPPMGSYPGGLQRLQVTPGVTLWTIPGTDDVVGQVIFIISQEIWGVFGKCITRHDPGQMVVNHAGCSAGGTGRLTIPKRQQYLAVVGYKNTQLGILTVTHVFGHGLTQGIGQGSKINKPRTF